MRIKEYTEKEMEEISSLLEEASNIRPTNKEGEVLIYKRNLHFRNNWLHEKGLLNKCEFIAPMKLYLRLLKQGRGDEPYSMEIYPGQGITLTTEKTIKILSSMGANIYEIKKNIKNLQSKLA